MVSTMPSRDVEYPLPNTHRRSNFLPLSRGFDENLCMMQNGAQTLLPKLLVTHLFSQTDVNIFNSIYIITISFVLAHTRLVFVLDIPSKSNTSESCPSNSRHNSNVTERTRILYKVYPLVICYIAIEHGP
jgi:hypothetical protein